MDHIPIMELGQATYPNPSSLEPADMLPDQNQEENQISISAPYELYPRYPNEPTPQRDDNYHPHESGYPIEKPYRTDLDS